MSLLLRLLRSIQGVALPAHGPAVSAARPAARFDQLTIVSLAFPPISFSTGYFGQNFEAETNNLTTAGSFWVLGVALPITVATVAMWLLFGRPWNTARRARSRQ